MSLHIIHLTDIHISTSDDIILSKAESMAKACCANIDMPADIIIAITGDIAFSGDESQYVLFGSFIDKLVSAFNDNTDITSIRVFTVPGNHDCNFSKATKIREKLIGTIDCRSTNGYEEECVSFIAKEVQSDYYALDSEKCIGLNHDDYLYRVTQLNTSIGNTTVLQYNTAWISTKNEQAGSLCMPIDLFPEMPVQESDLVIAMMHHPFCWMHPDNKSAFEIHMRNSADIILCGHEHFQDSVRQDGKDWSFYVLEGKELQTKPQIDESCFSVYSFDQTLTVLKTKNFRWDGDRYSLEDEDDRPFSRNQSISQPIMSPNNETIEELRDAGAIFHHPQIEVLSLNDIYVWPSLEEHSVNTPDVSIITEGDKVYEQLIQNPISIIYGEETCGKTSLAKQIYLECLHHGKCCIKGTGKSFTSKKEVGLLKEIEGLFVEQYSNGLLEQFYRLDKKDRILIIDDFEQTEYNNERILSFLTILKKYFSAIILMIEGENELPFILTRIQMEDMYSYRLKHFGNRKRERLIEKWYSLGKEWSVRDSRELDAVVESASRTINELLGRFSTIMPATPLTVLSILQTIDVTGTTIVNGHSYAYERLVQHSMDRLADGSPITQNVYESSLSNLAYKMLENKQWAIASNDLVQELSDYSEKALLGLDVVKAISKIERSRILVRTKENKYKFRYPYLYYYFCGLYISKNLLKKDVKRHIEYMASKLHVVEYGNIMIFICHFVNNEEILQSILLNALCTLDGVKAFDFNTPHALLDEAFSDIGKLLNQAVVGDEMDVRSARERDLDYQDERQLNDGTVTEQSSDRINDGALDSLEAGNIVSALRIMDVLGQILRSYPGDFTGENKKEAVGEIKDLSMRIVGIIYEGFSALKGEIVNDLFKKIKHDYPRASDADLKRKVQLLFNSVVFSVAYCMVHKASCTIATPILIPVLESMADEQPGDLAIRIMLSDVTMLSQTKPQYERIIATHRYFKNDNHHYAQETLRMLVAQHLRHRRCGEIMRDRLCTEFGLKKIDVLPPLPVATDNS